MKIIHFIKIRNFKIFGDEIVINLEHPSVLIGPNNSGKTSALQAIALWAFGVKSWHESKGKSKATKNLTSGINRLNLLQLPVQNARYLWKNTDIRRGSNELIPLEITAGIEFQEKVYNCKMTFTQQSSELIYCLPDSSFYENRELLDYAAKINIDLLYSMSGVAIEEVLLPPGRINSLIGQGQTSEVLRNLCYQIFQNDNSAWKELVSLLKRLFQVTLQSPKFIETRGVIELKYKSANVKNDLDISLAGRGLQQFLLLFSYMFSHKNSVLLLDEPDAHLEILRQRTIYFILKEITKKNGNQLIIATHSEVILNEAADTNLEMLLDGEVIHLSERKEIKIALRDFGVEHYYKAKQKKSILYTEGSTDIEILREFAKIYGNVSASEILNGNFNYYYTQNIESDPSSENELDRIDGYYSPYHKKHFNSLKSIVPEFKGLAVFDSDGKNRQPEYKEDLTTFYWSRYEIENYFINPFTIKEYAKQNSSIHGTIFEIYFNKALAKALLELVFDNDQQALDDFNNLTPSLQLNYWNKITSQIKLSHFLESVFQVYKELSGQPIPINKGRFYELVKYHTQVDEEVKKVLELIVKFIS
jgi:predicted ATPase